MHPKIAGGIFAIIYPILCLFILMFAFGCKEKNGSGSNQGDYKFKDAFIPQSQNMMDNSYLTMKAFNYGVNLLFGRR